MEKLQLWENPIELIEPFAFNGLQNLKILELNISKKFILHDECFKNLPNLEIISFGETDLDNICFDQLKFLNARDCVLNNIIFMNKLENLEFLDFQLNVDLIETFENIHFNRLKFLALKCDNVPMFNSSFRYFKGKLELIDVRKFPSGKLINLLNLECLSLLSTSSDNVSNLSLDFFNGLQKLKYFLIEIKHDERNERAIEQNCFNLLQQKLSFSNVSPLFDPLLEKFYDSEFYHCKMNTWKGSAFFSYIKVCFFLNYFNHF